MKLKRMALVIAVCASVGALAGIAGSAAAPSKKAAATQKQAAKKQMRAMRHAFKRGFRMGFGPGFAPGFMGGPVHATAVVPKRDGSGFDTITEDAGTLLAVDGTTVHLKEATDKATYKDDVGIVVGSAAKVIRDGAAAALSDLQAGDHVRVITGAPKGNLVIAADDAWIKKHQQRFHPHGWGPGGPGGPPPGAPAPGAYPGSPGSPG